MLAIFIFYNQAQGIQSHFTLSRHFKHVDVFLHLTMSWVVVRLDKQGIRFRLSNFKDGRDIVDNAVKLNTVSRIVAVKIGKRAKYPWRPFRFNTCNELARLVSGLDIGFTYHPRHLYRKLLYYSHRKNFEILNMWGRHGRGRARRSI